MGGAEQRARSVEAVRPFDADLLGLEPHPDDPGALALVVSPRLCRLDGRLYGGAALSAALCASEAATGREALWSSTQLVGVASLGDRLRVDVEVLAGGRSTDQVQVRGTTGDTLVFNAVGATATARPDGMAGVGQTMPRVPGPDDCEPWGPGIRAEAERAPDPSQAAIGHNLVMEHRDAPLLDAADARPGRMAVWTRLTGDLEGRPVTPAGLGFMADFVPVAVTRACGVVGAGTSLDNSLRVGEAADSEWVLVDIDAHVAVGGYGHGDALLWSPDGRLLAVGSQSARLFSIDDFVRKQASGSGAG